MRDEGQLREDPIRGYDPWTQALAAEFKNDTLATLQEMPLAGMTLEARQGQDSLWLVARWPGGGGVAFRTAYSPGTGLKLNENPPR